MENLYHEFPHDGFQNRPKLEICQGPNLKHGYKEDQSSSFVHFMILLNPTSLFGCALYSWMKLKACKRPLLTFPKSSLVFEELTLYIAMVIGS